MPTFEEVIRKVFEDSAWALRTVRQDEPYIEHPFARGGLTSDGIQYGSAQATTGSSVYVTVSSATVYPRISTAASTRYTNQRIKELEFGLTGNFISCSTVSTTAMAVFKWQAKDRSESCWTVLYTSSGSTASFINSTAYVDRTVSGYANVTTGLQNMPLDIRLQIKSGKATAAAGRVKNSSYVKITPARGQ